MRWGEQITLIALSEPSPRTNEHGFPVARTETATTVFADKKSVGFSAVDCPICGCQIRLADRAPRIDFPAIVERHDADAEETEDEAE